MPTVRDATVSLLRELGMTTIFGNPGSTGLPLFKDCPVDFRYVLGLQESIVVGMADGSVRVDHPRDLAPTLMPPCRPRCRSLWTS